MPIHNFISTGTEDIGKVHIYTGASYDPINKAYYFDGAEYLPIYSAGDVLYDYGTQNVALDGVGANWGDYTVTFNTNNIRIAAKGSYGSTIARTGVYTAEMIDLTPYNTIRFVVSGKHYEATETGSTTYSNGFVGMYTDGSKQYIDENGQGYAYKPNSGGGVNLSAKSNEDASTIRTCTLDISNVNGLHYVGAALATYTSGSPVREGYIYQIILE